MDEPGTMMMGVKLQGAERWKAWGAVALFTFLAILQTMGNFMPAYLYEQVSRHACNLTQHTPTEAAAGPSRACSATQKAQHPIAFCEDCQKL